MALAANLIVEIGLEIEFVGENIKSGQSAIVAALSFRFNFVPSYERCVGLVIVADGTEILFSFGHDNLAEKETESCSGRG